jgi:hypothetical protein
MAHNCIAFARTCASRWILPIKILVMIYSFDSTVNAHDLLHGIIFSPHKLETDSGIAVGGKTVVFGGISGKSYQLCKKGPGLRLLMLHCGGCIFGSTCTN